MPGQTTPFPYIVTVAPPAQVPGIIPSSEKEESKTGEVVTLPPLPIPPSMTDVDAPMAPTGTHLHVIINNRILWNIFPYILIGNFRGLQYKYKKVRLPL